MILSITEKLLIFRARTGMTQGQLANELDITHEHLSAVFHSRHRLSDKLMNKIELLFRRYEFTAGLDDEGRL